MPRQTIVQDYLATNAHADWDWLLAQRDTLVARMRLAKTAMLEPLLRAEAVYLDTLFATLDEKHGGVDGYLNDVLSVDAKARDAMRGMLLD